MKKSPGMARFKKIAYDVWYWIKAPLAFHKSILELFFTLNSYTSKLPVLRVKFQI